MKVYSTMLCRYVDINNIGNRPSANLQGVGVDKTCSSQKEVVRLKLYGGLLQPGPREIVYPSTIV